MTFLLFLGAIATVEAILHFSQRHDGSKQRAAGGGHAGRMVTTLQGDVQSSDPAAATESMIALMRALEVSVRASSPRSEASQLKATDGSQMNADQRR